MVVTIVEGMFRGGLSFLANFSVPNQFLKQKVTVTFRDGDDMTAKISEWTDQWLLVETENAIHLIPWSAIADLRVMKPKEKETKQ